MYVWYGFDRMGINKLLVDRSRWFFLCVLTSGAVYLRHMRRLVDWANHLRRSECYMFIIHMKRPATYVHVCDVCIFTKINCNNL